MDNSHHGGSTSLSMPRAHRTLGAAQPSIMTTSTTNSTLVPLTAPLTPLRPSPQVSLVAPRPENERTSNNYVETPFRSSPAAVHTNHRLLPSTTTTPNDSISSHFPLQLRVPISQSQQQNTTLHHSSHNHHHHHPTVTKQPTGGSASTATLLFLKPQDDDTSDNNNPECIIKNSIVCPSCGRCRCQSCGSPRALPEKWICQNRCLLSADTIIDYASCFCCVKGLFYHCSESDGGAVESCVDNPCTCGPSKRAARWSCLGALSVVLPCLWLYWPLQGCKRVIEMCHAQHSRSGCRCQQQEQQQNMDRTEQQLQLPTHRQQSSMSASPIATHQKGLLD